MKWITLFQMAGNAGEFRSQRSRKIQNKTKATIGLHEHPNRKLKLSRFDAKEWGLVCARNDCRRLSIRGVPVAAASEAEAALLFRTKWGVIETMAHEGVQLKAVSDQAVAVSLGG